jgi:transmembrane sensor
MKIDERQFQKLLDAYIQGTASPAEKKLLDDFFASYPEAEQGISQKDDEIKHELWMKLSGKLEDRQPVSRLPLSPWYSIAATVLLCITMLYFLVYKKKEEMAKPEVLVMQEQTAETIPGQRLKIELIDGSEVVLNANSKLRFPQQFTGTTREVYLEGEAYFHVAHDSSKPFIVHTASANTTVLGTSFNVRSLSANKSTEITLVEGKVNVGSGLYTKQVHAVILTPNQQAIVSGNNEAIVTKKVDVSYYIDWKDNILHFNNITVREAAALLEQWYNVDITFQDPALGNCVINATYQKETLPNILKSMEYMLKITCTQKGNTVVMQGNGCNMKPKQNNI